MSEGIILYGSREISLTLSYFSIHVPLAILFLFSFWTINGELTAEAANPKPKRYPEKKYGYKLPKVYDIGIAPQFIAILI